MIILGGNRAQNAKQATEEEMEQGSGKAFLLTEATYLRSLATLQLAM